MAPLAVVLTGGSSSLPDIRLMALSRQATRVNKRPLSSE
jgi:hypothetical protein